MVNYNGQTPLFAAVREGNIENVMTLIEDAGSKVDLTGSEASRDVEN